MMVQDIKAIIDNRSVKFAVGMFIDLKIALVQYEGKLLLDVTPRTEDEANFLVKWREESGLTDKQFNINWVFNN
jgi:hypothetical protein